MVFQKSQSTVKPKLIEVLPTVAYIRKNLVESEEATSRYTDENGEEVTIKTTFYNYDEARLTIEEFNAYANEKLMAAQENSEVNQLTLMEAMADLYEASIPVT